MQQFKYHAEGVDLDLLARQGVAVEDFKVAQGQVHALVSQAVHRLTYMNPKALGESYVGHSGGKDSVLIHHLVGMTFGHDRVPVLHTPKLEGPNTVHPLTRDFLYSRPYPIIYYPGRPTLIGYTDQVDGTRKFEATRNDGRSTNVIFDGEDVPRDKMREFTDNGLFGLRVYFPIYDWTDAQVWAAIHVLKIPYSLEYVLTEQQANA